VKIRKKSFTYILLGCPGQALCEQLSNSQANKTEMEQLRVRMSAIKHKILVVSGKGGDQI
jgi:Mrp family chromosome partitioning ATPase